MIAAIQTHVHVCVYMSSNLDPNIRLTFCDGDCISLLFHTSPFLGGNPAPFLSRKTHFLGYPDGGEIKGVAETKGADKIKEGQRRDSMLQPCNPRYRDRPPLPSPHSLFASQFSLPHSSRYKEKDSGESRESYI